VLIKASGHIIQLPTHVLAGQREELPRVRRAGLAQGLEEPLDDGAEQLVRLQVRRRPGQAGVAAEQEGGAELMQPADGPVQQGADDRLGGRITGQLVQVALDGRSGVFLVHGGPGVSTAIGVIVPRPGVNPQRLDRMKRSVAEKGAHVGAE
jgi:hypothetical protein